MVIFEHSSYKEYLSEQIQKLKRPGLMTELAQQAGCDRTYLSQVLSGKPHLTPDHAINLASALGLNEAETDYFLLLVLKGRATNPEAIKKLETKLDRLRKENMVLSKTLKKNESPTELSDELKLRYYSSWRYSAAHILTSIPRSRDLLSIANALGLAEEEAKLLMEELIQMGLVAQRAGKFLHNGGNLHIPSDSPLIAFNHLNWRMKAMEHVRRPGGVHYTNVFSVSKDDVPVLVSQLIEFIEKQRKKIHTSGVDEAHAFCCDLFPVG